MNNVQVHSSLKRFLFGIQMSRISPVFSLAFVVYISFSSPPQKKKRVVSYLKAQLRQKGLPRCVKALGGLGRARRAEKKSTEK